MNIEDTVNRLLRYFERLILAVTIVTIALCVAYAAYLAVHSIYVNVVVLGLKGDPDTDVTVIQNGLYKVYGSFLTILLGLELINTVKVYFRDNVVKLESIFVIAILALSRHLIQIHFESVDPMVLIGAAAMIGVLIAGYVVMRRNVALFRNESAGEHPPAQ